MRSRGGASVHRARTLAHTPSLPLLSRLEWGARQQRRRPGASHSMWSAVRSRAVMCVACCIAVGVWGLRPPCAAPPLTRLPLGARLPPPSAPLARAAPLLPRGTFSAPPTSAACQATHPLAALDSAPFSSAPHRECSLAAAPLPRRCCWAQVPAHPHLATTPPPSHPPTAPSSPLRQLPTRQRDLPI